MHAFARLVRSRAHILYIHREPCKGRNLRPCYRMPRIRVPYSDVGPNIVLTNEAGDHEYVIESDLYKALYAFTPTIVKLPTHIRFGKGASDLLLESPAAEAIKASDFADACVRAVVQARAVTAAHMLSSQVDANIIADACKPLVELNQQLAGRKKVRLLDGSKARFKRCSVAVVLLTSARHVQVTLCHMECSCTLEEIGFSTVFDDKPIRGIVCWEMNQVLARGSIAMAAGFRFDTEPIHAMLARTGKSAFKMLSVACYNGTMVMLPDTPYEMVCRTDYSNAHCAGCMQPFGSGDLTPKRCSGCMSNVLYCSKACQRTHYHAHHKEWCEPEKMMLMRFWCSVPPPRPL